MKTKPQLDTELMEALNEEVIGRLRIPSEQHKGTTQRKGKVTKWSLRVVPMTYSNLTVVDAYR